MSAGSAFRLILALALSSLAPATAWAQLSGVVGAASDYRLRGLSLTDGRGVLTAGLNYDTNHTNGPSLDRALRRLLLVRVVRVVRG